MSSSILETGFVPYAKRLRELARVLPDRRALVVVTTESREEYTFEELDAAVDAYACGLMDGGVDERAAVIIASPNSAPAVLAAAAAWRLGAFVVAVSPKSTRADLEAVVSNARTSGRHVIIVSDETTTAADTPNLALRPLRAIRRDRDIADRHPHPARAIPTGGTTGRPKLIVDRLPWGSTSAAMILQKVEADRAARTLVNTPLYHNVGQCLTHLSLLNGKTAVLMDRFDAARAQELIETLEIEFFFAVPTHLRRFLDLPDLRREAFRSVKTMYHSAAYCPPSLKREWLEFLGPERVWEVFGATDGEGVVAIRGDEWLEHPETVGRPFLTRIKILNEELRPVPAGSIGLIYMRSDIDLAERPFEYLGAPMPRVTDDGYLTVGDMGWLDEAGYLHVADRRTDMIITGGANVFPAEVEAVLTRHPQIHEVAVIGITDADWGRRVHAIVVPADPANAPSAAELDAFMSAEIVGYKKPKSYEFRPTLLYTDVGKLDRRALTEQCNGRDAGEKTEMTMKFPKTPLRLAGRVAIVTGAGRGLGRAHALALAAHGAAVVVNDLGVGVDGTRTAETPADQVVAEITALGGKAVASAHDITDWDRAQELIQFAAEHFGRLDILVNNAGILRDRYFANMSEAEWDDVIRVHLRGCAAPTRHALAYWRERHKRGEKVLGSVINTTSIAGLFPNFGQANYAAAKAGVAALTQTLALEAIKFDVRVNAIAPSARTRLIPEKNLSRAAADFDDLDPANVSPLVVWLASPGCPANGQIFQMYGRRLGVYQFASFVRRIASTSRWTAEQMDRILPQGLIPVRSVDEVFVELQSPADEAPAP